MKVLRLVLPIVLGIIAGALNFIVLRGNTAPLELTVIKADTKADTEIAEDMLDRLSVRADKEVFKSAVPYAERGLLLGRRVLRPLTAGEVMLYADVQNLEEENIRLYLKPGESTLTIPVKATRIATGLRRGDDVGILVAKAAGGAKPPPMAPGLSAPVGRQILGPFRLLSLGSPVDPYRAAAIGGARMVMVAISRMPDGRLDPKAVALDEAITAGSTFGGAPESGILAVEYYQPSGQ